MSRKILFCIPLRLAAFLSTLTVLLIFGAGSAAGWYALYSLKSLPEYNSKPKRVQVFAGVLGTFASLVFGISFFGCFAVISKGRTLVRRYLWSTWVTFFFACFSVTIFALLLWLDGAWGVKNCSFGSDGKAVACQEPRLWMKIVASVVAAYGLFVQLYLTVILRLLYAQMQYKPLDTSDMDHSFDARDLPQYHDPMHETHSAEDVVLHNPHPEY